MDWRSFLLPFAYFAILGASFYTFLQIYRRRKARASHGLAPYFPAHVTRDIYFSLHSLSAEDKKVPDTVLRAALLNRAVDDIKRVVELRSRKPALQTLLQKGVVGDEIWRRLLRAEAEMEAEVRDVVAEANALSGGAWGATIFQSANEINQARVLKGNLDRVRASVGPERRRWEEQRESSRRELLEEGTSVAAATTTSGVGVGEKSAETRAASTAGVPSVGGASGGGVVMPERNGSDEDGVMVEPPAADGVVVGSSGGGGGGGGSGGGGGGGKKKKKGKK